MSQQDTSRHPFAAPYQRRHERGIYWYNKATDLRGAAGLVWAGIHDEKASAIAERLGLGSGFDFAAACWPVYYMLCGMALELLLKAAIVQGGGEPKATHKLAELWHEVGLEADAQQTGLLEILSESISWAGRYPVPWQETRFDRFGDLVDEHLMDHVPLGESGLEVMRANQSLDWPSFTRLWSIAHSHPAIGRIFK